MTILLDKDKLYQYYEGGLLYEWTPGPGIYRNLKTGDGFKEISEQLEQSGLGGLSGLYTAITLPSWVLNTVTKIEHR